MSKKQQSGKINNIVGELRKQEIKTWFDLGLFIDQLKNNCQKMLLKATLPPLITIWKKEVLLLLLSILLLTELLLKPKSMPKPLKESTRTFLFIISPERSSLRPMN